MHVLPLPRRITLRISALITESQRLNAKIIDKTTVKTSRKLRKGRAWTETVLKYFAIVLADEKN